MRAVIIGAGNIGRGLVGEVLYDSGYRLTFVDVSPGIVEMLRDRKSYRITSPSGTRTIPVDGALLVGEEESVAGIVARADVVATAVGGANLPHVARTIAPGIEVSVKPELNILACENVQPNSHALRRHLVDEVGEDVLADVGSPDVMIDRIAPGPADATDVEVEPEYEFVVDATSWVGARPTPSPIEFTERLDDHKLRKLWMVNGLHVLTAWLAVDAGHEHIHEAMRDETVRRRVDRASRSVALAVGTRCEEFDAAAIEEYRQRTLARFANEQLPDLATRVARNPLEKLAAEERVIPAALAAEGLGVELDGIAFAVAAALTLDDPRVAGLAQLRNALEERGIEGFLADRGVNPAGAFHVAVGAALHR